MGKRRFRRNVKAEAEAGYPTLDTVDSGRRAFFARIASLVGASAFAGLAAACGDRAVGGKAPDWSADGGPAAPPRDASVPPWRYDLGGVSDTSIEPDFGEPDAGPPMPDAAGDDG